MKMLTVGLITVLVAGCVSPEQAAINRQAQYDQEQAQGRANSERLRVTCDAMGYQRGTPDHSNCMLAVYQQQQANMGAAAAAYIQGQSAQPLPRCNLPNGPLAAYLRGQGRCQ